MEQHQLVRIPVTLKGPNYITWSRLTRTALGGRGLWEHITTIYYCHGHKSGARVFEVSLVTDDGRQRVVGPAVCHMNTFMWNADHVAFKVLKIEPRSAPVCHFFPLDNIV
ncbi:hypothetical protein F2Q69_00052013, partial [Brassica cretica]